MNTQPSEQSIRSDGTSIELVGRPFITIQSEGPFAGRPAVFIRTAGCNLQCPLCDTDYTTNRQTYKVKNLVEHIAKIRPPGGIVVITGGEPFRQNLVVLVTSIEQDLKTICQIETNGLLWIDSTLEIGTANSKIAIDSLSDIFADSCHIVCSPKTSTINEEISKRAAAIKYIIDADHIDPDDGLPVYSLGKEIYGRVARPAPSFPVENIYVQPCFDVEDYFQTEMNKQAAVMSCLKYGYSLSLQSHKELGLP